MVKNASKHIALTGMILAVMLIVLAHAESRIVAAPLDSCAYDVLVELRKRGSDISIIHPNQLDSVSLKDEKIAIIASYPWSYYSDVVSKLLIENPELRVYAVTDVLEVEADKTISSADVIAWCEVRDEEALRRIREALDSGLDLNPALVTLIAGSAALAGIGVSGKLSAIAREIGDKASRLPAFIAFLALKLRRRGRLDSYDLISHPLRANIIKVLRKSPASFTQLQEELRVSRAVLEWHLGVLKAYGVIVEDKNGKSRVYRISDDFYNSEDFPS